MAVSIDNVYELILTSRSLSDPDRQWRNTYTILATGGAPGPTDAIINACEIFTNNNQWDDSGVRAAELRPWTRGDVPLDEEGYIWRDESLNLTGDAKATYSFSGDGGGPADGDVCLLLHRAQMTHGGRVGKLFFHNLFRGDMLEYRVGAKPVLVEPYIALPSLVTEQADTVLGDYMNDVANDPRLVTAHWSAKPFAPAPFTRNIAHIEGVRVTEHKLGRHNG